MSLENSINHGGHRGHGENRRDISGDLSATSAPRAIQASRFSSVYSVLSVVPNGSFQMAKVDWLDDEPVQAQEGKS